MPDADAGITRANNENIVMRIARTLFIAVSFLKISNLIINNYRLYYFGHIHKLIINN
jgi:hypothetical protein